MPAHQRVGASADRGRLSDGNRLRVTRIPANPSPATALAIRVSRMLWRRRAPAWDEEGSALLSDVVDAVLARCGDLAGAVAVDLGCGSGQVTFLVADRCRHVLAVDIDPEAIEILAARARRERLTNIEAIVHPVETLELSPESVDVVVSNYALHHLRDADKRRLVERSLTWLRPGGRLVIGDMMFGRGADAADREIIRAKLRSLIRLGPGGWWRIVKNGWRFLLRFQERPLRPEAWESILRAAGFEKVRTSHVVEEASVISAQKPSHAPGHEALAPASCGAPVMLATPGTPPARRRASSREFTPFK